MATQKSTTSRTAKKSTAGGGSSTTKQAGTSKRASKKTAKASTASKGAASAKSGSQDSSSAADVAQRAGEQLADLTAKEVEGVTSLERTDEGWTVELDVVELRRVPSTTDVLATYQVDVDSQGELQGYRRAYRYVRGVAGEE